ncbi:MAG: response regulator [Phycisphaerales bacterium]|jgi:two-component system alkaline phosphatase synthesis response regulator PhoP
MTTQPDPQAQTGADEPLTGTVLVVDDNAQNAELLEAYLDDLGITVQVAHDGQAALDVVAADAPDLILMDIMMPRMSGYQATERLKSDPATRDIPIIMVTALGEVGDVERAVDCGADDFLTKPVNKLELLTRVRSLLRVRKLQTDLNKAQAQLRKFLRED